MVDARPHAKRPAPIQMTLQGRSNREEIGRLCYVYTGNAVDRIFAEPPLIVRRGFEEESRSREGRIVIGRHPAGEVFHDEERTAQDADIALTGDNPGHGNTAIAGKTKGLHLQLEVVRGKHR